MAFLAIVTSELFSARDNKRDFVNFLYVLHIAFKLLELVLLKSLLLLFSMLIGLVYLWSLIWSLFTFNSISRTSRRLFCRKTLAWDCRGIISFALKCGMGVV